MVCSYEEIVDLSCLLNRVKFTNLQTCFLNTLPYNAGTTAIDALWAVLPVVTQTGQAQVGRMAASALNAIEMPELITKSSEEYEALALELALNSEKLKQIK